MTVTVKIAETPRELAYCAGIQALVFAGEQNVDLDVIFDGYEGERRWYLLMTPDDKPVGVTAWRKIMPDTVKIERVALLKESRERRAWYENCVLRHGRYSQAGRH